MDFLTEQEEMRGKIHLKADGLYPRPGHTYHPGRTLCGRAEKMLTEAEYEAMKSQPVCKQCFRIWRKLALYNLRCGA